jgi:crotonobetainyl-CoA:carnitine CoA-transferase CaiB-like acyl-CoA transferase
MASGANDGALGHLRICDLSGQLAGAGATRFLAAMGAQVIRVEDPVRQGRWDVLRGTPPFVDDRRGNELSGATPSCTSRPAPASPKRSPTLSCSSLSTTRPR